MSAIPAPQTATEPGEPPAGFVPRVILWCVAMVVLIGGGTTVAIGMATGLWAEAAAVGGFLALFIAPALGGLFAGVLWMDRSEKEHGAPGEHRHRRHADPTPSSIDDEEPVAPRPSRPTEELSSAA
ncbi:MAG: hypothetical protein ACOYOP_09925 [Microthrixaceae bacterium]